jgi:hypothetical protein
MIIWFTTSAEWYEFWMPQSGPIGGAISGLIVGIIIGFILK